MELEVCKVYRPHEDFLKSGNLEAQSNFIVPHPSLKRAKFPSHRRLESFSNFLLPIITDGWRTIDRRRTRLNLHSEHYSWRLTPDMDEFPAAESDDPKWLRARW